MVLYQSVVDSLQSSRRTGKEGLEQGEGKEEIPMLLIGLIFQGAEFNLLLQGKQRLFLRSQFHINRNHLSFLEVLSDVLVFYIVFKAAHVILLYIFLGIFSITRDGSRFKHTHQIGK